MSNNLKDVLNKINTTTVFKKSIFYLPLYISS